MKYIAVEMSTDRKSKLELCAEINDTGSWEISPEAAWDSVKHVFSEDHTIIINENGRVISKLFLMKY